MSSLQITPFHDKNTGTMTYIIHCDEQKQCAIIDSVLDYTANDGVISHQSADLLIAFIKDNGLSLNYILETHVHADHLSASAYLKRILGGQIVICHRICEVQHTFNTVFNHRDANSDGSDFDLLLHHGDTLQLGDLTIKAIETPGHTPACMCYQIDNHIFVGDTIFSPTLGTARCDFPGGNAKALFHSIEKLLAFDDKTLLYVGHDYPDDDKAPDYVCSIQAQKANNPYLRDFSLDTFVEKREARDKTLSMPNLIFPSLQVNIHAGRLPEPESNGQRYLITPITGSI